MQLRQYNLYISLVEFQRSFWQSYVDRHRRIFAQKWEIRSTIHKVIFKGVQLWMKTYALVNIIPFSRARNFRFWDINIIWRTHSYTHYNTPRKSYDGRCICEGTATVSQNYSRLKKMSVLYFYIYQTLQPTRRLYKEPFNEYFIEQFFISFANSFIWWRRPQL